MIKMLLCKKVSQRICSFRKLKSADVFNNFNWDDLTDFNMKSPYQPEILENNKLLNLTTFKYESVIEVSLY